MSIVVSVMGCSRKSFAAALALAAVLSAAPPSSAASGELSEAEVQALESGRPILREQTIERDGHRYVGGVSYVVIDALPADVLSVLDDVHSYRQILPHTRAVRLLAFTRDGDDIVQLEQGNAIAHGKYSVLIHRDATVSGENATVRFRLDPRYDHDLTDANGFFHIEAHGDKTLVTYAIMLDLGPGLFGRLFEGRIRRAALSTPALMKRYVESRHPA